MKDTGKIIRRMEEADLFTLTEMFTRVTGKMTKPMERVYTPM